MMVQTAIAKAAFVFAAALKPEELGLQHLKSRVRLPYSSTSSSPLARIRTALPAVAAAATPQDGNDDMYKQISVIPRGGESVDGESEKVSFLQRHPMASACGITTINAFAADLLTQCVFESNPWNPKRSAVFAAFGFLYQGMAQYAIVNLGWERLFPGNKPKAVISKICAMNLLSDPILFMPTFYIFKQVMITQGFSFGTVKAALLSYKANCLLDWRNSWMVWFPGHAVTYGVMRPHQRIPWMAFLSFFYMCILSITRGGS
eukprot:scaffold2214_cov139-Cylindrotheca_fusiformis.AAC.16